MSDASPPTSSALDEETARAEIYGLLAQLFYAPPAPELLAALRVAPTEAPAAGGFLEEPWRALVGLARAMGDAEVAAEFDALFGGVGKPEVYLFGSHYLTGFLKKSRSCNCAMTWRRWAWPGARTCPRPKTMSPT